MTYYLAVECQLPEEDRNKAKNKKEKNLNNLVTVRWGLNPKKKSTNQ